MPDPRDPRGMRHSLVAMLALTACAVLAGAKSLLVLAPAHHRVTVLLALLRDGRTYEALPPPFTDLDEQHGESAMTDPWQSPGVW
ncbi:transposase family protein [Streptomyces sp. NPDC006622]|uniref:transposase family protein n=1 Tax=Streptomyces sp. NPDC006622 TaxID=3155459 RepID=UPI0033A77E89